MDLPPDDDLDDLYSLPLPTRTLDLSYQRLVGDLTMLGIGNPASSPKLLRDYRAQLIEYAGFPDPDEMAALIEAHDPPLYPTRENFFLEMGLIDPVLAKLMFACFKGSDPDSADDVSHFKRLMELTTRAGRQAFAASLDSDNPLQAKLRTETLETLHQFLLARVNDTHLHDAVELDQYRSIYDDGLTLPTMREGWEEEVDNLRTTLLQETKPKTEIALPAELTAKMEEWADLAQRSHNLTRENFATDRMFKIIADFMAGERDIAAPARRQQASARAGPLAVTEP